MSASQELRELSRLRPLQLFALVVLLVALAALGMEAKTSVLDPDIWWHIKVGDWIVQHHAVPHVGIFSRTAATRPWVAYSWGSEVLQSRAYAWFGLLGFGIYGVVLTVAVAWALFWMTHRLSHRFWVAWLLCAVGSLSFLFSLMPRPVFFSMILFMVMLTLLLEAERAGKVQALYWLPLLFVLWANLHIQFIYGLFTLGLYVAVQAAQEGAKRLGLRCSGITYSSLPWKQVAGIFGGCALACCVGPYTYHLFGVVFSYSQSKIAYEFIQELQALTFHFFTDYVLLLFIAGGFFVLGRAQKVDLFKLSLLVVASLSCFRTTRDAWFAGACVAAFAADSFRDPNASRGFLKPLEIAGSWVVATVALILIGMNMGFTPRELDRVISSTYPVDAVNHLRRNPVPGPLYNTLDWGGFLIWYMPDHPVAIDGRNDLYGDEIDLVTFKSVAGDYQSDPYLQEAGVILLPKQTALAALLTIDPRFRKVYEDGIAVVFARD